MNYANINADTITRWIEAGWEWGKRVLGLAFGGGQQIRQRNNRAVNWRRGCG